MRHQQCPSKLMTLLTIAVLVAACGGSSSTGRATGSADPSGSISPSAPPTESPSPTPTSAPTPGPAAIVPVGDFRTTVVTVGPADVSAILDGKSKTYDALELVAADSDAILAALSLQAPSVATRLVLADSADALAADLAAHRTRLALMRASQVGPSVRALQWQGKSLFGVDRVRSLSEWPLTATLVLGDPSEAYDPAQIWTVVAGGDTGFDRNTYTTLKKKGKEYSYDGGTVTITGHYQSAQPFDWPVPRYKRTGNAGLVRHLLSGADVSMLNLEGPAPKNAVWHPGGVGVSTVFNFDQSLVAGLKDAGIDVVALGNNHIRNAGAKGIIETIQFLDGLGIAHSGAGANSDQAHQPAMVTVGDQKVAVLSYDNISGTPAAATATKAGEALLASKTYAADIQAARDAGATVVIVYPHWGVEYTTNLAPGERTFAHEMIDAGADIIIGNHPHWSGAMEVYKGKPIWYALGNFIFDQWWQEQTMEGLMLELTFSGDRLVQAWMRPLLILDNAQPNLLDPAGSGAVVLDRTYKASGKMLPW